MESVYNKNYRCVTCYKEVRLPDVDEIRCSKCTIRHGIRRMLNLLSNRRRCRAEALTSFTRSSEAIPLRNAPLINAEMTSLERFYCTEDIQALDLNTGSNMIRNKRRHETDNENSLNEPTTSNRRTSRAKISRMCQTDENIETPSPGF